LFAEIPAAQNSPISSNLSQKSGNSAGSGGASGGTSSGSTGLIRNNHLEVFEDKHYRYDTHGNLIQKKIGAHTIIDLTWDVEHQLSESIVTRVVGKSANDPREKPPNAPPTATTPLAAG
jgi:hypothetical protein